MVFKRRTPKTYYQIVAEAFYPKGGWRRAAQYVLHRLRRLPDPAHKISRGIAAGVFVSFTPLFGFHFIAAAAVAWVLRGNILAALLATFVGNPLTFPFIAAIALELGSWMLGSPPVPLNRVGQAFSDAFTQLWDNFYAIFTPAEMHWDALGDFFQVIIPGIIAGLAFYYLSYPLIVTYQKARDRRRQARAEKKRRRRPEAAADEEGQS